MRCASWNDNDIAAGYLAFFVTHRDSAATFLHDRDFNVRVHVQLRPAARRRIHKIYGYRRTSVFADELARHSYQRQLPEMQKTHAQMCAGVWHDASAISCCRRRRGERCAMQELSDLQRRPSPTVTPQALAWNGEDLWLSSRDLKRLYRVDAEQWKVQEELEPPGVVWAAVAAGNGLRFTIGEGENDDRYVYRYTRGGGFTKLFACPDFTGSYLSFDGEHLYLSQWYEHRILQLDHQGATLREINVGAEICGHVIVDDTIYLLRGTEQNGESWKLARMSLRDENGEIIDVAALPFASRSLAFDGTRFWSNHRSGNEVISFRI